MRPIELLAPARNADIGIAAIDCGADAVYIAGPQFGARKDAGNPVSEIARLCSYASRYGARVFVTFNILLRDDEFPEVHSQMLECQKAGASAFIIRDPRLCLFEDITVPLHASTQCSIRSAERAREFERAGCGRVVLERQLDLPRIREICSSVQCEVEAFVHGALCVGYSGQCILSERLTGRSADRGECIQACRNLYDLVDETGRVWQKNKALLSLKDLNLLDDLTDLLDAGVTSLKIEGRLKNISYVRNVTRAYSLALDRIVAQHPDLYCRASFGRVEAGFTPSLDKTFNRSYTHLLLDTRSDDWANFEAPKSMGQKLGTVREVRPLGRGQAEVVLEDTRTALSNGDGFAFVAGSEIVGFRGDVCRPGHITCRLPQGLKAGTVLYRNLDRAFESYLDENPCRRVIGVEVSCRTAEREGGLLDVAFSARSEDGRTAEMRMTGLEASRNPKRELALYRNQIEKHSSVYAFSLSAQEGMPAHLGAAALNSVRRDLAVALDSQLCASVPMLNPQQREVIDYQVGRREGEVMRSRYCIRRQTGECLKSGGKSGRLFLMNNGRKFPLIFDCRNCEMAVGEAL